MIWIQMWFVTCFGPIRNAYTHFSVFSLDSKTLKKILIELRSIFDSHKYLRYGWKIPFKMHHELDIFSCDVRLLVWSDCPFWYKRTSDYIHIYNIPNNYLTCEEIMPTCFFRHPYPTNYYTVCTLYCMLYFKKNAVTF